MNKKTIAVLFALLLAVILPISAFADDDPYGTYQKGINVPKYSAHRIEATMDFMNGDFEEGLRYWANCGGGYASNAAKLIDEGENTFIQLTGVDNWDGIVSPRFYFEPASTGQQIVVIYDWRGSDDFQIFLEQWDANGASYRLGGRGGKTLYEAKNNTEWNTSITKISKTVQMFNTGNENHYFSVGVQVAENPEVFVQIDNLRLGVVNPKSGKVYDFDGNLICPEAYEDTENDFDEALAGITQEQLEEIEQNRRPNNTKQEETDEAEEDKKQEKPKADKENNGDTDNTLIVVSVVVGVVVLFAIAAVIAVVIVFSKKRK